MSNGSALYLHIPFCRSKCVYCDFASFAGIDRLAGRYVEALLVEMETAPALNIKTIYIGGGTPTQIPVEEITKILSAVYKKFRVETDAEVTVEANPATADGERMKILAGSGVNRVSVGVQTFDGAMLKTLGRPYSTKEVFGTIDSIRKAGIENISMDIMFGLPDQTEEALLHDLKRSVEIAPAHLSAYQLSVEEETPLHKAVSSGELKIPDEAVLADMYESVIEHLTANGYRHYEVSNYALPGRECRHNLVYWMGESFIGLGSAAHSFLDSRRYANRREPEEYIRQITEGDPEREMLETDKEGEFINFLLMRLRLVGRELLYAEIDERFDIDFRKKYETVLEKLTENRFLKSRPTGFVLNHRGLIFLNNLLLEFMDVR